MGRETAQPASVVDHGSADAVHHAAERERELAGCLGFVATPAWRLALELPAHFGPAVVGGAKLVRPEVLQTPVRPGLQSDDIQPGSCQLRGDESADAAHADQDHISPFCWRRCPALGIEFGDRLLTL